MIAVDAYLFLEVFKCRISFRKSLDPFQSLPQKQVMDENRLIQSIGFRNPFSTQKRLLPS